jgi:hypothetical protein
LASPLLSRRGGRRKAAAGGFLAANVIEHDKSIAKRLQTFL